DDLLLVGEVVVEIPGADGRALGDVIRRHRSDARDVEELDGDVDDPISRLLRCHARAAFGLCDGRRPFTRDGSAPASKTRRTRRGRTDGITDARASYASREMRRSSFTSALQISASRSAARAVTDGSKRSSDSNRFAP